MLHKPNAISVIGESVDVVRALRARNFHTPEQGSDVHLAWAEFHAGHPSACYYAYSRATAQIGAAEDHLLALQGLLEYGGSSVTPFVVARAGLEASGRAFALLAPDLSDSARSGLAVAEKLHELGTLQRLILASDPTMSGDKARVDLADTKKAALSLRRAAKEPASTFSSARVSRRRSKAFLR